MRAVGSTYATENSKLIALYTSNYPDVYFALPRSMNGRHLMHVQYSYQNRKNSIDLHLPEEISKKGWSFQRPFDANSIHLTDQEISDIFTRQNVHIQAVSDIKDSEFEKNLLKILAQDISQFCKNPSTIKSTSINYTQEIIPVTSIGYVKTLTNPVSGGKADFIDGCVLDGNLDFVTTNADCIANFIPGKNASYNNGVLTGYYVTSDTGCLGCYAEKDHLEPYVKRIWKIEPKRLYEILMTGNFPIGNATFGKHVNVLRLGKRTDTGSIYTKDELAETLEVCIKAKTRPVMPTKFLEFDECIAKLFVKSKGSLIFSKSDLYHKERLNDYEFGAIAHGCDWDFRIEQAEKYLRAGVKTSTYLMTDVVYDKSQEFFDMMNDILNKGLDIQILDVKITKKDVAQTITGRTWEELKGKFQTLSTGALFGEEQFRQIGGYSYAKSKLVPDIVNPKLAEIVAKNHGRIRMCNSNDGHTWCGTCFMYNGFVKSTIKKELVPFPKYKKQKDNPQKKIDFDNIDNILSNDMLSADLDTTL